MSDHDPRHASGHSEREDDACGGGFRERSRKERVLHTRISEQLSDDIRKLAEELKVPVSNLVRNVLEETFTVVEAVSENWGDIFEDVAAEAERAGERLRRQVHLRRDRRRTRRSRGYSDTHSAHDADVVDERDEAPPPPPPEPAPPAARQGAVDDPDIMGWQALRLNRAQSCAECHRVLARGAAGYVAVGSRGLKPVYLCDACGGSLA